MSTKPTQLPGLPRPTTESVDVQPDDQEEIVRLAFNQRIDVKPRDCSSVQVSDFYGYMPQHHYIFVPSREPWPAVSVNARCEKPTNLDGSIATKRVPRKGKNNVVTFEDVEISASEWLDQNHPVDQMTWAPGAPLIVHDKLVSNGGWIERPGCAVFNLYMPPQIERGDPNDVAMWIDHVYMVFPNEAEHIIQWLAHRVQRPGDKINHALILGGGMGIGKDTILEPMKHAVGAWNFNEVTPQNLLGRFNGYVKSVILRVSEARDLGDLDRFAFYDHMKIYTAAPPDVLRCDEKNLKEHAVMNVCGVIITTNHKTDGIYLPADDRRNYVAWSELRKEDIRLGHWNEIYHWYENGGTRNVAAYLAALDLTGFDPKAPPPKTPAFYDIVHANRSPEDAELADALDVLDNPPVVTLAQLAQKATAELATFLQDRKCSRLVPHRLDSVGYVRVTNEAATDGLYKILGKRQAVYAKKTLSVHDRYVAVRRFLDGEKP